MSNNEDNTKVTWGSTSWMALALALAQFTAALVIYLLAPEDQKIAAAAPLVTAAVTVRELIRGRMEQASAKALNPPIATPELDKEFGSKIRKPVV